MVAKSQEAKRAAKKARDAQRNALQSFEVCYHADGSMSCFAKRRRWICIRIRIESSPTTEYRLILDPIGILWQSDLNGLVTEAVEKVGVAKLADVLQVCRRHLRFLYRCGSFNLSFEVVFSNLRPS